MERKLQSHHYTSTAAMLADLLDITDCLEVGGTPPQASSQPPPQSGIIEKARLKTHMVMEAKKLFGLV